MSNALRGKRIINTRAAHQAADLDQLLQARGAIPVSYPCIAIKPPEDSTRLDAALQHLRDGQFDWLALTSANTVFSLAQRLQAVSLNIQDAAHFKIAAVGISTADAVREHLCLDVDLLPDEFIAESLAVALIAQNAKHVLLPESAIARPTLAQQLTAGGVAVTGITAYQTVCGDGGVTLQQTMQTQSVDVVTFTSSSTVDCFVERLLTERLTVANFADTCMACIGPKTAKTAYEQGFKQVIVPDEYTLDGMLNRIDAYFVSEFER